MSVTLISNTSVCCLTGWIDATDLVGLQGQMVLCKLVSRSATPGEDVYFSLRIHEDFSWTLLLLQQHIDPATCSMLQELPQALASVADVEAVLNALDSSTVCTGNDDSKFSDLAKSHNGTFMDASGKVLS